MASMRYSGADMSRPDEATGLIDATVEAFGSVDIGGNAGIQHAAPIESFLPGKWDAIRAIMLDSAFHTIRRAIRTCSNAAGPA
ncbi:MAG: hypothetical protein U5K43_00955 [Halofilum sp. (in: g-proteobacteria)]|nr:hypothetical protein [Halofilum sp. (in: g-proteobacteria)]